MYYLFCWYVPPENGHPHQDQVYLEKYQSSCRVEEKRKGGERRNTKLSSSFCNENLNSLSSVALVDFFCVTSVATLSPLIPLTSTSHSVVLMLQLRVQHIFSPNMPIQLYPSYSAFLYEYISAMKRQ